jgi:hypothetical protein
MQVNADAGGVVLVVGLIRDPMVARRKATASMVATPTEAAPTTRKVVAGAAVVVTNRATARHTKAARFRHCPKVQKPSKTSRQSTPSRASTLSIPAAQTPAA